MLNCPPFCRISFPADTGQDYTMMPFARRKPSPHRGATAAPDIAREKVGCGSGDELCVSS